MTINAVSCRENSHHVPFFLRKFASCADVVKKLTIYLSPRSNLGLTLNWHEKEIYSVSNVEEQKRTFRGQSSTFEKYAYLFYCFTLLLIDSFLVSLRVANALFIDYYTGFVSV